MRKTQFFKQRKDTKVFIVLLRGSNEYEQNLTRDFGVWTWSAWLSMHIRKGIFRVIGPNGAGKTTTQKLLCSLYRPTAGCAFINDIEVTQANAGNQAIRGYMPDNSGVYDQMSVWEYLRFFSVQPITSVRQAGKPYPLRSRVNPFATDDRLPSRLAVQRHDTAHRYG